MKSIKRRLTFHFSFQFIAIIVCVCCVLFCALMFLAYYLSKQDIKRDLPSGSLSLLTADTTVKNGKATVSDDLAKQLKQEGLWYQVLNKQGKVIGEINPQKDLPKHYGLSELLEMDKTKKFKGYNVVTELDTFLTTPTYYILGYKSDLKEQLYALYSKYHKESVPPKSDIPLIKKALKEKNASLQILNDKGDILASIRMSKEKTSYDPLEIISRKIEQDKYDSTATVFHDSKKKIS
ncbi:hypothetical protein SAMN04487777_10856 [Priestia aryabhattai B8W22]|nr:hypothetical protein SAMN04487777_10856 [Priestia aryabhattai B8W22]